MGEAPFYRVQWAEQAVRDLESIITFVARDSPNNAKRLLKRLRERADGLYEMPDRGRVVPELARFGIVGLRELVARPYRIIYRVHSDQVTVLAVLDGRRDLGDVLFDRLLRSSHENGRILSESHEERGTRLRLLAPPGILARLRAAAEAA